MFGIEYKGIPIKTITREAFRELSGLGMDLYDVQQVLEEGFDCFRSTRRKGIAEKCVRKGKKLLKVVVEKMQSSHGEECWRVRHAGILEFKRKRFLVKL